MTNANNVALSRAEIRLRRGKIAPLFRKYAIPGVITLLFLGLQTIIDGVILGNYVGANALASVSLALPCYSLLTTVAIVIGIGCQTVISIRLGELNQQGANDAFRSAFLFLLLFSIVFAGTIYIFTPEVVRLIGANDVLIADSISYLRALMPFFPMIVVMFFCDYIIKSIGRPVYSMAVMTITVILNIVLDLLFVIEWDMGTAGAGLATGLAFSVGTFMNLYVALGKKNKILSLRRGRMKWRLVWNMMYNGSSEGMSELSAGISTLLFNLALMKYVGEGGVAAFTAINYVFFIGITVFLGVSDGIIPIVSYNYGAGQWSRIKQTLKLAAKCNVLIGLTLFLILTFFGEFVISIFFRNGEAEVLKIASQGTSIYAFAFLLNGLNILSSSYFTAMANAKISIIISSLRGLVFVAIGIFVLPEFFGIEGIWYTVPIAELLTFFISVFFVVRSLKGK